MKPDFTTWPPAPDYCFARTIIARLQEDTLLSPLVFEEPFDREDQCQKLAANARALGGCVMVSPQTLHDDYPEARTRVLRAEVAVTILATNQLTAGQQMTSGEVVATIRARVLHQLCGWSPSARGIAYEEPQIAGCYPLDTAPWQDWQNLLGATVVLCQRMQF